MTNCDIIFYKIICRADPLCYCKSKNTNSLQHIVVLHSVQKLTRYRDRATIVLLGSTYVYGCNNFLHEPHSCKNRSVCYKKTMLNIDWRILSRQLNLSILLFNSFFSINKTVQCRWHRDTWENTSIDKFSNLSALVP